MSLPVLQAKQYCDDEAGVRPERYFYIHRGNSLNHKMQQINPEDVIGFEALYDSAMKCRCGVMWKDSVAGFILDAVRQILKLEEEMKEGRYHPRAPLHFKITFPKERDAESICIRDRAFQRSLNDNAVYPMMTRGFIYDNAACQKGKGTEFARKRLSRHLRRFYRKHGLSGFVLQCDIHGYYVSMRHDVAKAVFRKYLDDWTYSEVCRIIDTQYPGDVGFTPGSQLIQIAGIAVLSALDHFIKERLRIRHYIRYMDDFVLMHPDPDYLAYCRDEIEKWLAKHGFEFNPKKTQIYPVREGIPFLGFRWKLTETGKILILIDPKNVKARRKKLRRMVNLEKKGLMREGKVTACQESWKAHALQKTKKSHNRKKGIANTHRMVMRMDAYIKELREEEYHFEKCKKRTTEFRNPGRQKERTGTGGNDDRSREAQHR